MDTPVILSESMVVKMISHEDQVMMYLNAELKLNQMDIQKNLVLLQDHLGPNTVATNNHTL